MVKSVLYTGAVASILALSAVPANAAGCLSGAAVGGVAGHVAGGHGKLGAAAGCAVGHHEAVKQNRANAAAANAQQRPATPDNGSSGGPPPSVTR